MTILDGSQGKEAKYVIFDMVTPDGGMPLGFLADARRMNVAFSRARDGRIVVGNLGMAAMGKQKLFHGGSIVHI